MQYVFINQFCFSPTQDLSAYKATKNSWIYKTKNLRISQAAVILCKEMNKVCQKVSSTPLFIKIPVIFHKKKTITLSIYPTFSPFLFYLYRQNKLNKKNDKTLTTCNQP